MAANRFQPHQMVTQPRGTVALSGHDAARRRKVRMTVAGKPCAPNVLDRRLTQPQANRAWAAGLSYLATTEGFLYLAVILDLYSRKVIGWSLSERRDR